LSLRNFFEDKTKSETPTKASPNTHTTTSSLPKWLSGTSINIISFIFENGGATSKEIAEFLEKPMNNITPYVYRLQKCGLISKTFRRWFLTEEGVKFLELLRKKREVINKKMDIKEIEIQAIEKVLAIERAEGRLPSLMPPTEHYDIKSIDPSTGEVRLIEVKGHKGFKIHAELTEDEVEVALKEKERYWLYIVYNIGNGMPKVLKIQNPLESNNFQIIERVQKRYFLQPKKQRRA